MTIYLDKEKITNIGNEMHKALVELDNIISRYDNIKDDYNMAIEKEIGEDLVDRTMDFYELVGELNKIIKTDTKIIEIGDDGQPEEEPEESETEIKEKDIDVANEFNEEMKEEIWTRMKAAKPRSKLMVWSNIKRRNKKLPNDFCEDIKNYIKSFNESPIIKGGYKNVLAGKNKSVAKVDIDNKQKETIPDSSNKGEDEKKDETI